GRKLNPFVFWVYLSHRLFFSSALDRKPQRTGTPRRTTQARIQDRALGFAASWADLSIRGNFYDQFSRSKYLHLAKAQIQVRK
ncbi:hypothetical protein EMPG_14919, partial [Blastomyces silverae]